MGRQDNVDTKDEKRSEMDLHSRRILLDDGRYMIFFTFGDEDAEPCRSADPITDPEQGKSS